MQRKTLNDQEKADLKSRWAKVAEAKSALEKEESEIAAVVAEAFGSAPVQGPDGKLYRARKGRKDADGNPGPHYFLPMESEPTVSL